MTLDLQGPNIHPPPPPGASEVLSAGQMELGLRAGRLRGWSRLLPGRHVPSCRAERPTLSNVGTGAEGGPP